MVNENIYQKQTVDSYTGEAFLKDMEGVARFQVIVINNYLVEVETFGVSHSRFDDLRTDVRERLKDAGFNLRRLNIEI